VRRRRGGNKRLRRGRAEKNLAEGQAAVALNVGKVRGRDGAPVGS